MEPQPTQPNPAQPSAILETPPRPEVSATDVIYLLLWLYQRGKTYWPTPNAGAARQYLSGVIAPHVVSKLGDGRIENDADDSRILLSMDAMRGVVFGYPPGDYRDAGSILGNPFLLAAGNLNNLERWLFGEDGRDRIGYLDFPPLFDDYFPLSYRAQGKVHRRVGRGPYLKPYPEYEHANVPWTITQGEDGVYEIELDPEHVPHPVITEIMQKNFGGAGGSAHHSGH